MTDLGDLSCFLKSNLWNKNENKFVIRARLYETNNLLSNYNNTSISINSKLNNLLLDIF